MKKRKVLRVVMIDDTGNLLVFSERGEPKRKVALGMDVSGVFTDESCVVFHIRCEHDLAIEFYRSRSSHPLATIRRFLRTVVRFVTPEVPILKVRHATAHIDTLDPLHVSAALDLNRDAPSPTSHHADSVSTDIRTDPFELEASSGPRFSMAESLTEPPSFVLPSAFHAFEEPEAAPAAGDVGVEVLMAALDAEMENDLLHRELDSLLQELRRQQIALEKRKMKLEKLRRTRAREVRLASVICSICTAGHQHGCHADPVVRRQVEVPSQS